MTRPGLTTAAAAGGVVICAAWNPGVPVAAAAGLLGTALVLLVDAAGAHGGPGRHLPALIAGGSCTVLVAAALLLPAASTALASSPGWPRSSGRTG